MNNVTAHVTVDRRYVTAAGKSTEYRREESVVLQNLYSIDAKFYNDFIRINDNYVHPCIFAFCDTVPCYRVMECSTGLWNAINSLKAGGEKC